MRHVVFHTTLERYVRRLSPGSKVDWAKTRWPWLQVQPQQYYIYMPKKLVVFHRNIEDAAYISLYYHPSSILMCVEQITIPQITMFVGGIIHSQMAGLWHYFAHINIYICIYHICIYHIYHIYIYISYIYIYHIYIYIYHIYIYHIYISYIYISYIYISYIYIIYIYTTHISYIYIYISYILIPTNIQKICVVLSEDPCRWSVEQPNYLETSPVLFGASPCWEPDGTVLRPCCHVGKLENGGKTADFTGKWRGEIAY